MCTGIELHNTQHLPKFLFKCRAQLSFFQSTVQAHPLLLYTRFVIHLLSTMSFLIPKSRVSSLARQSFQSILYKQKHNVPTCRLTKKFFSTTKATTTTTTTSPPPNTSIHVIPPSANGGASQYILLPSNIPFDNYVYKTDVKARKEISKEIIGSVYIHRNILFGATFNKQSFNDDDDDDDNDNGKKEGSALWTMTDVCGPLVDSAIQIAEQEGEQMQAVATLHGLSDWIIQLIQQTENQTTNESSTAFSNLLLQQQQQQDSIVYEAVKAIATGIPRPGHSVVGQGTYRDAKEGWISLAREYADKTQTGEVGLYKSRGAEIVSVEYLADTSEKYLKAAGGSMVRMYFM